MTAYKKVGRLILLLCLVCSITYSAFSLLQENNRLISGILLSVKNKIKYCIGAMQGVVTITGLVLGPLPPPSPSPSPLPLPPGGGGGGVYIPPPVVTQVNFSGRAYPKSAVTLLKDAQIAATTIAGADANFQISISGISGGNYIFSVYAEDSKGIRSCLLTFPINVTPGVTTKVSGIFIAPTIAVDKSEVKRGDNIAIFGQSAPNSEITIAVNSDEEFFAKTPADKNGVYLYNFDTSPLAIEQHFARSKSAYNGEISSWSKSIGFLVSTKSIPAPPTKCPAKTDLNNDCRVNLVDFSIAAYWYKRPLSAAFKLIEQERLSGDAKIDLVDFSIMAYYWTG